MAKALLAQAQQLQRQHGGCAGCGGVGEREGRWGLGRAGVFPNLFCCQQYAG
jgi:hypothetical protein